jgi:hypothetical protein
MSGLKAKILVCLVWAVGATFLFSGQMFRKAHSQIKTSEKDVNWSRVKAKPDGLLIDAFDAAIQKRFLTEPNFGIRRIMPTYPVNPHFEYFAAQTEEEKKALAEFENGGWKVFLYLFGRRAGPRVVDGKQRNDFSIRYRINQPVVITQSLKREDLPKGEKLLDDVKAAFLAFQTPNGENENNYEFSEGKWSYVARPVRAVNESCVKCHTDYVITEKLKDDKYKFRKRKVGDANGVLVYGFTRDENSGK